MLQNGICLCPRCHKFGPDSAHQSLVFYEWLRRAKPEQWDYLLHHYDDPDPRSCKKIFEEFSNKKEESKKELRIEKGSM